MAEAALTTARLRELVTGRLAQLREGERLEPVRLGERQRAALAVLADHAARFSPGFAARLELHQEGYGGVRGMTPPTPYVHHGALL